MRSVPSKVNDLSILYSKRKKSVAFIYQSGAIWLCLEYYVLYVQLFLWPHRVPHRELVGHIIIYIYIHIYIYIYIYIYGQQKIRPSIPLNVRLVVGY